jgi:phage gpG-like protein
MKSTITKKEFEQLVPKIRTALNKASDYTAEEVWGNLREFSPQDNGRLAGSWKVDKKSERVHIIGTSVVYAAVQNDGVGPYDIFPRKASALHFKIGGKDIFARRVRHPGIKGKHYVEKSINEAHDRIADFVDLAIQEVGL